MKPLRRQPALALIAVTTATFLLAIYFAYAAVQSDSGILRRVQVVAEANALKARLAGLQAEIAELENHTRRLSDAYLDLDLLDERARVVLGYIRPDEIVIR